MRYRLDIDKIGLDKTRKTRQDKIFSIKMNKEEKREEMRRNLEKTT